MPAAVVESRLTSLIPYLTRPIDPRCGICVLAPWRSPASPDRLMPTNVCSDYDRLFVVKLGTPKCGDDPWNPNDVESNPPDVSGLYTLFETILPADACWNGFTGSLATSPCTKPDGGLVPGIYFGCDANILQGPQIPTGDPNALTARVLCYTDSPGLVVNPDAQPPAFDTLCPPAPAQYCGDGMPGAPPPGCTQGAACAGTGVWQPAVGGNPSGCYSGSPAVQMLSACNPALWLFAHVPVAPAGQTMMNGTVDKINNTITLAGCIVDDTGHAPFGNVYQTLTFDMHTGHGTVGIYLNQPLGTCMSGPPPVGSHLTSSVDAVRQAGDIPVSEPLGTGKFTSPSRATWDTDGDGCPDVNELLDDKTQGGMRDPFNRWDFFDSTHDGRHRADDILFVVQHYGTHQGGPGYSTDYDRTYIGPNAWNLGPPNGAVNSMDITQIVRQYGQDCA